MRVSVVLTSRNRDRFLVEALDSALAQRVDGGVEIVIGDDASEPPTREILERYRAAHPDRIRLVQQPRRIGLPRNFAAAFAATSGEFVALLDDDDLWTSPDKLQRQVDYLDAHPECSMCFHVTRHFHEDGSGADYFLFLRRQAELYTMGDLLSGGFIPTSSTFVRRRAVAPLPEWFRDLRSHEWTVHLLAARHGAIGFLDEEFSATRIHSGGDWNGSTVVRQQRMVIHNVSTVRRHFEGAQGPETAALLSRAEYELALEYRRQGDFDRATWWAWRSIVEQPRHRLVPLGDRVRLAGAALLRALDARLRFSGSPG